MNTKLYTNVIDELHQYKGYKIAPGVSYYRNNLKMGDLDESVYHLEIDPQNNHTHLLVMSPEGKVGKLGTVNEILEHLKDKGKNIVAGVNGDFFSFLGIPSGLQIINREVITSPKLTKALMAVNQDHTVSLHGEVKMYAELLVEGEVLQLDAINRLHKLSHTDHAHLYNSRFRDSTKSPDGTLEVVIAVDHDNLFPMKKVTGTVESIGSISNSIIESGYIYLSVTGSKAIWTRNSLTPGTKVSFYISFDQGIDKALQVISANSTLGSFLVKDGKVASEVLDPNNPYINDRHPRTMVATKEEKLHIIIFDGRQPAYSDGITMAEGAHYLRKLGMEDAINIDGGGSTTCYIRLPGDQHPSVVNRPSDGFERAIGNALTIVSEAPLSQLNKLITIPSPSFNILVGSQTEIVVKGHDEFYNAVNLNSEKIHWSYEGEFGDVNTLGTFTAGKFSGKGRIFVDCEGVETSIDVTVSDSIKHLIFNNTSIVIEPGKTEVFSITAYDDKGDKVLASPEQFSWSVTGNIGRIDEKGKLFATTESLQGKVIVKYKGVQSEIYVNVGQPPIIIEDFETLDRLSALKAVVVPNSVSLSKVARPLPVRYGTFSASLTYDFTGMSGSSKVGLELLDDNNEVGRMVKGAPSRFSIWVYGDSQKHWLRLSIKDAHGQNQSLNFTEVGGLNWTGWKYVYAEVPDNMAFPLKTCSILLLETNDANKNAGEIYLDRFRAEYVNLNEDVEGPVIQVISPEPNALLSKQKVEIKAKIIDLESGVDPASISIMLDGSKRNHRYNKATGKVTYITEQNLSEGTHRVVIEAVDKSGNPSVPLTEWEFHIVK